MPEPASPMKPPDRSRAAARQETTAKRAREPHSGQRGRIEVICGGMFSGKTVQLIARVRAAQNDGLRVAVFKPACDDRYADGEVVTHDGRRADATVVQDVLEIPALAMNAEVVAIDEAQFFSHHLLGVSQELANLGRRVIVAGLDRDSWGLPFEPIPSIAAIADEAVVTHAVCARCGRQAEYTQRLTPVEGRTMIGGAESYEPRCAQCFQAPPLELRR